MLKKSLFILIGLINIYIASAQTDTITYAECEIDTIPNQYDKLLKYFLVDKEDVNHLWKFNTVDWGTFKPSIAYEQRIKGRSSFELEAILKPFNYNKGVFYVMEEDSYFQFSLYENGSHIKLETNLDYRFYYNKKKRAQKGKQTNGFSGNYLFLGGGLGIDNRDYLKPIENSGMAYTYYEELPSWTLDIKFKIGYGIQRRIGNIGYADFKFGVMYDYYKAKYSTSSLNNMKTISPFIDINLGFGLNSLKRPLFK